MEGYSKKKENNNEGSSEEEYDQNGEVNYKITLEDLKKQKRKSSAMTVSDDNDYKITLDDLKAKKMKSDTSTGGSSSSTENGTAASGTKGERTQDELLGRKEVDICSCKAFNHTCGKEKNSSTQPSTPKPTNNIKPSPASNPSKTQNLITPTLPTLDGHFLFDSPLALTPGAPPEGIPCSQCDFIAKTPKGLAKHSHVHKRELEGPYNCTVCKYQGKSKVYLARHMLLHGENVPNESGEGAPLLSCEHCQYTTRHPASMTRHRNSHEDQSELRKFQCEKCDYRAKRKDHLERHMFTHIRNDNEVLIP